MTKIIALCLALVSISIFANEEVKSPQICYTHGQCQTELPKNAPKCFLVKIRSNSNGEASCVLRCPEMPMGSYCEPVEGRVWGICKKESYSIPNVNDCSAAIDPEEL